MVAIMYIMVLLCIIATLAASTSSHQRNVQLELNEHVATELRFDGGMSLLMRGMRRRSARPPRKVASLPPLSEVAMNESHSARHNPRITLVSWLASEWSDDGFVAMRNNRRAYAESHGYQFLDFNETNLPTPQLRQNWRSLKKYIKPRLLLALMDTNKSDWVIWTDADTLYTNATIPWANFLEPENDLVFAEASGVVSNDGVFAVRVTPWSKSFLEDWLHECDINAQKTSILSDNGPFVHSILRAYAKSHNVSYNNECRVFIPTFHGGDTKLSQCYQTHLQRISNASQLKISGSSLVNDSHIRGAWGINSGLEFKPPCKWKPGDFLLHFAGQPPELRRKRALEYSHRFAQIQASNASAQHRA